MELGPLRSRHGGSSIVAPCLLLALALAGCQSEGTGPVTVPPVPCEDPSVLKLAPRPISRHNKPVRVRGVPAELPGMTWAKAETVGAFFGNKPVKVVFTLDRRMYLAEYAGGEAVVTTISSDDEGLDGLVGSINSPLFSPDGKKLAYAGTTRGKPAFIRDAVGGDAEALRIPLDPKARVTADPHWHTDSGKTYIYFSTLSGLVGFKDHCQQVAGSTYRSEVYADSLGFPQVTRIPGAYRGGLSKDGRWAGTSYASTALFDRDRNTTLLLAGGEQQCNPSMNPYPPGSRHSDYMMVLAFGGTPYGLITGETVMEGLHENLWIYNSGDKIVWRAKRPDEALYERFDKPEWSTHPDFATSVALRRDNDGKGDLIVVRIGDLANAEEGKLNQAQGYLKIAEGRFDSDSYSHLWVAE